MLYIPFVSRGEKIGQRAFLSRGNSFTMHGWDAGIGDVADRKRENGEKWGEKGRGTEGRKKRRERKMEKETREERGEEENIRFCSFISST